MISLFVPMIYFSFFTFALVLMTKRSFGKCLPLSLFAAALMLFLSQLLFGTFSVGFWVGIIIAICSIPLTIWRVKKEGWKWVKERFFTAGFAVFLVIMVVVFIYDLKRGFSTWDEYSHWGMMLKEMLRLDKFYFVDASNLMVHKDYPPMLQLFELFWLKLCGGGYSEIYAERAVHTFSLALILPMIFDYWTTKKELCKKIFMGVLVCVSMALIVLLFDQHGVIQTIYNDYPMAIVVVYLILSVTFAEKVGWFEIMEIVLGGSFLLLLKQMGLPLYLMVLCLLAIVLVIRKGGVKKALINKTWKIMPAIMVLLLPFVWWLIWNNLTSGVAHQFDLSNLSITDFVNLLLGRGGEEWQKYTVMQYLDALGQRSISTSYVQISFLQSVVACVAGLCYCWYIAKKKIFKKELIWLGMILIVGAVGYAVSIMFLYVTSFGSYEGPILASFERYMGTYAIIMLLTVALLLVWHYIKEKNYMAIGVIAIFMILLTAPAAYAKLYPSLTSKVANEEYIKLAEDISEEIGDEEDAKLFVVSQGKVGFHYYLQYQLNEYHLNNTNFKWETDDPELASSYYRENILPMMSQYDYLYVADVDEDFQKQYCDLIGRCPVEQNSLYKINKINDDVRLKLVSSKEIK